MQKFMRLRCEIGELVEEIDSMTESTRDTGDGHVEGLSIQVQNLSQQLESCQLDTTDTVSNVNMDILNKQIDALKKQGGNEKNSDQVDGVYQVYVKPDPKPTVDIATLDSRLAKLEKIIGNSSASDSKVLSTQTDHQNLAKCMQILESRKSLLNPQHIDHVEGRLSALTYKINSISEQKTAVEAANKDDKLSKLSGLLSGQCVLATAVLPHLVTRLESVAQLQTESSSWSEVVSSVEQQQRETREVIRDTEQTLVETRNCFDTNMADIYKKCDLLQTKLNEIK